MTQEKVSFTQKDFTDVVKKLSSLHLWGFSKYKPQHFLYRTVIDYMLLGERKQLSLKQLIKKLIFRRKRLTFSATPKDDEKHIILYKSSVYFPRKDMQEAFHGIIHCTDRIRVMEEENYGQVLDWPAIFAAPALIQWKLAFRGLGFSDDLTIAFMLDTLNTFKFLSNLKRNRKILKSAGAFLVMDDEYCDQNIFVQYGQKNGIPTATLQHGSYMRTHDDNDLNHYSHVFENVTADRIFVWGEYYKQMAIRSGVLQEKAVSTGILRFFDSHLPAIPPVRKTIGLFLDESEDELIIELNTELIQVCNRFAKEYGYRYYVKVHPGENEHRYDLLFDPYLFLGVAEESETVTVFSDKIDLAISGMSTVFVEMIFLGIPVFRCSSASFGCDTFEGIEFGRFSDYAELERLYKVMTKDPSEYYSKMKRVREYCCGEGNPGDRYRQAFEDLLNYRQKMSSAQTLNTESFGSI